MGTLRFICSKDFATPEMLRAIHLLTFERQMISVSCQHLDDTLQITFPDYDNIRFCIPWTIPGIGNKLITTGTLIQTDRPYHLSIELARGLCVSIRNQASDWETLGLQNLEEFWSTIQEAGRYLFQAIKLAQATTESSEEVDKFANYSMQLSSRASLIVGKAYIERVLILRRVTKLSADAATALNEERTQNALSEESLFAEKNYAFDDEGVTKMLGEMEKTTSGSIFDDSFSTPEDDISDDDTAIHVIETVTPKHVGVRVDYNLLEKGAKEIFFKTFNHIIVDLIWSRLESHPELLEEFDKQFAWCNSNGFLVTAGPLINFFPQHLPDFLAKYRGNFDAICFYAREYVEKIVKRYRHSVSTWIATSRVNSFFPLGLTLAQQLELTSRVIGWIHEFQPTAEIITSFDQPWGENVLEPPFGVGGSDFEIYPSIACADYVLRTRPRLSGLQLELNIGYLHSATYDRPLLDWSRMVDRWSVFGLPLYLLLRVPSSSDFDPKALIPTAPIWNGWNLRTQALWVSNIIPLLLSKPKVYGVDWSVFRDYRPHDYPNAGLISSDGHVKKSQAVLAEILKCFLADMDH